MIQNTNLCEYVWETERDTEEREERETDRQKDRQTERKRERERERERVNSNTFSCGYSEMRNQLKITRKFIFKANTIRWAN